MSKPNDTDHLFDVEEITKLLQIPSLVAGTAPGLTQLSSEAMARLREINDGLAKFHAARKTQAQVEASGQPVANPTPSKSVERPDSQVAEETPDPDSKPTVRRI